MSMIISDAISAKAQIFLRPFTVERRLVEAETRRWTTGRLRQLVDYEQTGRMAYV